MKSVRQYFWPNGSSSLSHMDGCALNLFADKCVPVCVRKKTMLILYSLYVKESFPW